MLFEQLRPDISSRSRGRGLSAASWATEMFSPLEGIKGAIFPRSVLAKGLIIISNEARSLAGERLKIRPEGGEKESGRHSRIDKEMIG